MTGTTGACGRLGEASCGSRSRQRRRCASASEICRTRSARFSSGVPTAWVNPLAAAVDAASARSVPTRPSRDSSTATTRGWSFSSAAAARVVFGAAGKLTTQPVTAATIATASKAAAVSGTRTASGLPGSANGAIRICGSRPAANRSDAAEFTTSRTRFQHDVSVGVVVEFDHQPAQRALDVSAGHAGYGANRFFDHRGVFVPARERQQRVQIQVHSSSALPAHGRRRVSAAVGRAAGRQERVPSTGSPCRSPGRSVFARHRRHSATLCTPACNIWTAPPATPPTKAVTPGTLITHPSQRLLCRSAPPGQRGGVRRNGDKADVPVM